MNQSNNKSKDSVDLYQYLLETAESNHIAAEIFERKGWSKTTAFFLQREKDFASQAVEIQKKHRLEKKVGEKLFMQKNEYQDRITIYAEYIVMAENAKKYAEKYKAEGLDALFKFFDNKRIDLLKKAEDYKKEQKLNLS